ncbi:hypothetical protein niasHT_036457 [Heterodera trifolii]|uniref:Nuclear receptor domain-containing protein n=1 Tax=Heterodera trifolii TaxID=157864 RepID=A0ABD2IX37_9BILA
MRKVDQNAKWQTVKYADDRVSTVSTVYEVAKVSCKQFFRRVVTKQILFTCPRRNGIGNMVKCRGCRLDKCLVAGMDPTMINVPQSDKFKQFLANLEKRKRSTMLMQKW